MAFITKNIIMALIFATLIGVALYLIINQTVNNHNKNVREKIPQPHNENEQQSYIEEINNFNNIQQNARTEDIIYFMNKILFWLRLLGIYFVIIPILIIIIAIIITTGMF